MSCTRKLAQTPATTTTQPATTTLLRTRSNSLADELVRTFCALRQLHHDFKRRIGSSCSMNAINFKPPHTYANLDEKGLFDQAIFFPPGGSGRSLGTVKVLSHRDSILGPMPPYGAPASGRTLDLWFYSVREKLRCSGLHLKTTASCAMLFREPTAMLVKPVMGHSLQRHANVKTPLVGSVRL